MDDRWKSLRCAIVKSLKMAGRRSNVIATCLTTGCHGSKKVASAAETRAAAVPATATLRKNCRRDSRLGGEDFAAVDWVTSGGQPGEDCRSLTRYFRFRGTGVFSRMPPRDILSFRLPV